MLVLKQKIIILFASLFVSLHTGSCGDPVSSSDSSAARTVLAVTGRQFDFYDKGKFDVSVNNHWSDGGDRFLIDFNKFEKEGRRDLGRFFAFSEDGGLTFGQDLEISAMIKGIPPEARILPEIRGNSIALALALDQKIYFSVSRNGIEGFSVPVIVYDNPTRHLHLSDIASLNESHFCLVWQENREGLMKVYSSVTENEGKTWSMSAPLTRDVSTGIQENARVAAGENGRLHATWTDWSDQRTLADIRYAYSNDGGLSWAESVKLNDDSLPVWQIEQTLIADGETVIAAFADFREKGTSDDNDWNVYYAKSDDNGVSWKPNRRLNKNLHGRQEKPQCDVAVNGGIYCVFISTEETVFGRIMVTASPDLGETWTPEVPLSDPESLRSIGIFKISTLKGGRLALKYVSYHDCNSESTLIEAVPDGEKKKQETTVKVEMTPLPLRKGRVLFIDRFSGAVTDRWEESKGLWEINDGVYTGVGDVRGSKRFSAPYFSFAKFDPPEAFVLTGRFKLDKTLHTSAYIMFNVLDDRYFAVTNEFRRGAWFAFDNNPPGTAVNLLGYPGWCHQPIAQKYFPFKSDTWYKFELSVAPDQVDYYVNGELLFSGRPKTALPPGKIGIGGHGVSPVFFDEIEISELTK